MDESTPLPEELIAGMSTSELAEVLEDLGIEADEAQAAAIQRLVAQLGSLEAAIEAIDFLDETDDRMAA
jgi:hypothetical protein